MDQIRVRGARTHNLKNISVDLPRRSLVVITGLSGSGKSSLAFDTLYAEGQRRYVESLSAYARQFLQRLDKPDVDLIEGLSPAIAIEQKSGSHNPRSTVGTITEIHDYLRLLYARVGTPFCPEHLVPLQASSISQMVDTLLSWSTDQRIAILAPVARAQAGQPDEMLRAFQAQGYVRVQLNGDTLTLDPIPELPEMAEFDLDVVVDRLRIKPDNQVRLADSLENAIRLSDGKVIIHNLDDNSQHGFSSRYACPECDYTLTELEPRLFSFNNPAGACPSCDGLGHVDVFDPQSVVLFPSLSLSAGAIYGWDRRNAMTFGMLSSLANHFEFDLETPWEELPASIRHIILHGSGEQEIPFLYISPTGTTRLEEHPFEGIIPHLERRWRETDSNAVRETLSQFRVTRDCSDCHGSRLRVEARHVLISDKAIYEVEAMPLLDCQHWFDALQLEGARQDVADRIVREIRARLTFLNNVGLTYLALDRRADTISGGEAQRIRLASQIGSGLTGVMYVLDEPSIGLHQRDNDRLIATLTHLRDLGNSVLVVEHDKDMILAADWVIDMGPGAGEHGGQVVAQGTPAQILSDPASETGLYLSGQKQIQLSRPAQPAISVDDETQSWLKLTGCTGHNLKNVDLSIPIGQFVCVTGVSGSGKSTLVNDTLAIAAANILNRAKTPAAPYDDLIGIEQFERLIRVDQSPIGRTPRSNPATYTGLFTPIRELFAGVPEARARGYDLGRFSFNVKGGRCEACQGDGVVKVEMHFLPDMYVPCDVCHGKRYNRETLEIRYRGLNIHEVLDLTIEQALPYFEAVPSIARRLQTLMDVGLSYIRLGQSATTLSGGEAQRIKLSLELSKRVSGKTLYVLDEPTTGLHLKDIDMLLQVLFRLVTTGNTVVVIEHNLDVIQVADWVIDMGPEGGQGGGQIIAQGTPEQIMQAPESLTGQYLARELASKRD